MTEWTKKANDSLKKVLFDEQFSHLVASLEISALLSTNYENCYLLKVLHIEHNLNENWTKNHKKI